MVLPVNLGLVLISVVINDIISTHSITLLSGPIAMAITMVTHRLNTMVTHPLQVCNSSNIDVCIWWGIQDGRLWGEVHPGYLG